MIYLFQLDCCTEEMSVDSGKGEATECTKETTTSMPEISTNSKGEASQLVGSDEEQSETG